MTFQGNTLCTLLCRRFSDLSGSYIYCYCSVPGKHPWVLKHNTISAHIGTQPGYKLHTYRYMEGATLIPLKINTWVLIWEWMLTPDTTIWSYQVCCPPSMYVCVHEDLKIYTGKDMGCKYSNFFCKHSKFSVPPSIHKACWPNKPSVEIFFDVGMGRVSKL